MMCRDEYIRWACNVDLRMLCDAKYMQANQKKRGVRLNEWDMCAVKKFFYLESSAALYYGIGAGSSPLFPSFSYQGGSKARCVNASIVPHGHH